MFKKFILAAFFLTLSCATNYKKSLHIAVIDGELMTTRLSLDTPAPFEGDAAMKSLEQQAKPVVQHLSRNRALELFKSGEVDMVVSGQASAFPEEFKKNQRLIEVTRAVLFYKGNPDLEKAVEMPSGLKVGLIKDSSFTSHFVKQAGHLEVHLFNSTEETAMAFNSGKVDCVVIDKIAEKHFNEMVKSAKIRPLELPSQPIFWLFR